MFLFLKTFLIIIIFVLLFCNLIFLTVFNVCTIIRQSKFLVDEIPLGTKPDSLTQICFTMLEKYCFGQA